MATPLGARNGRQASKASGEPTATARVESVLMAYRDQISGALRDQLAHLRPRVSDEDARTQSLLAGFYGQMEYHFGWRDSSLAPATTNPGKLLRPALVLLATQLCAPASDRATKAALVERAMPAAVAIEMVHNFSLIHDDIEDGDEVRRHRATLWRVWGPAQAINTGDGLFTLARASLLELSARGVPADVVTLLAARLDMTCLRLCEGQHLDMSFEGQQDVTPPMYLAMIERKTAALMECATEIGARLGGAGDSDAASMADFGRALGMGFQLRDDLLGIWASDQQLGKKAAGDLRRKKMSLPVIYAMAHASASDRHTLADLYGQAGDLDDTRVEIALSILERTGARRHARDMVCEQCHAARGTLDRVARMATPTANDAWEALAALVDFIEADVG